MRRDPGRLQLVATLGPASWPLAAAMAEAGATRFRVNASHLDPDSLGRALADFRRDLPSGEVVLDLQGAKMRVGMVTPREIRTGDRVAFGPGQLDVPLPHPELAAQVAPGDTLSLDDARLRFSVVSSLDGRIEAVALNAGRLLPRKGVNVEEHPIALARLTPTDRNAVEVASGFEVRTFAYSFMTDGREADWLRAAAPGCRVVGKVERREATGALRQVAGSVDEIWICRGDLGAQLGPGRLARFVASVAPPALGVPVLMAGQVLEHATRHREVTRAEICHLYDLIRRGYAGIVLSDETAIGDDPVGATALAARLLEEFAE